MIHHYITQYNSKFSPVKEENIGELREIVDRKGKVCFLGRIVKVTKDRVAYKIEV